MKLMLELDEKTISIIEEMRALKAFVDERESEADKESKKIDYTNFPEYTKLHNLNSDLSYRLARAGRLALDLTI